jgi:hypothetical protein
VTRSRSPEVNATERAPGSAGTGDILTLARSLLLGVEIKQQAPELIDTLPETATWADLLYALEVRADVEAGIADARAGRVTSVEDLQRECAL